MHADTLLDRERTPESILITVWSDTELDDVGFNDIVCLLSFAPDETVTCFGCTINLDLCETQRMQVSRH